MLITTKNKFYMIPKYVMINSSLKTVLGEERRDKTQHIYTLSTKNSGLWHCQLLQLLVAPMWANPL